MWKLPGGRHQAFIQFQLVCAVAFAAAFLFFFYCFIEATFENVYDFTRLFTFPYNRWYCDRHTHNIFLLFIRSPSLLAFSIHVCAVRFFFFSFAFSFIFQLSPHLRPLFIEPGSVFHPDSTMLALCAMQCIFTYIFFLLSVFCISTSISILATTRNLIQKWRCVLLARIYLSFT